MLGRLLQTNLHPSEQMEKMHKIEDLETSIFERLLAQETNITIELGYRLYMAWTNIGVRVGQMQYKQKSVLSSCTGSHWRTDTMEYNGYPSVYRYTRTQPRNLGQEQFEKVSRCAQLRVTAMWNKYLRCYFIAGTAIKQLLESMLYKPSFSLNRKLYKSYNEWLCYCWKPQYKICFVISMACNS